MMDWRNLTPRKQEQLLKGLMARVLAINGPGFRGSVEVNLTDDELDSLRDCYVMVNPRMGGGYKLTARESKVKLKDRVAELEARVRELEREEKS